MDGPSVSQGAARTAAELRLQLAQMTAAVQVLERDAVDEKNWRQLAAMEQSICRMLRIVGRLELSERLDGDEGPAQLKNALIDLAQLTRDLGGRMGELLAHDGVELTVNAPGWMGALADEGLVRQMLMELVSNAAKAGKHVALTLAQNGERAAFIVEDDGPGMDLDELGRLFFGAEEGVPDGQEAGVGIAIVRRVCSLHGGTLVVDCVPGKGLRVAASIPLGTPGGTVFRDSKLALDPGGFKEELIALSGQLPLEVFRLNLK